MASEDDEVLPADLFKEPNDYYQPRASPRFVEFSLLSGKTLRLRLVGSNPLWGHYLWNGAQVLSRHLQTYCLALIKHKTVLELGAGAGLPSLVAAIHGADRVVVTDYPDAELVENLQLNIDSCPFFVEEEHGRNIIAEGYLWGADTQSLLNHLPNPSRGFDTLLLADLLFNHHCHDALVSTICLTMARTKEARALVFFTPYRPWLLEKDLAFFDLCRARGLVVKKLLEETMEKVMFEQDKGNELLRRTVFGYEVRRPDVPSETIGLV